MKIVAIKCSINNRSSKAYVARGSTVIITVCTEIMQDIDGNVRYGRRDLRMRSQLIIIIVIIIILSSSSRYHIGHGVWKSLLPRHPWFQIMSANQVELRPPTTVNRELVNYCSLQKCTPPRMHQRAYLNLTGSSAVAASADRTAYDVRYTGKLSNRCRLQVDERLVRTIRFNG